jgi:hypothetical protein
MEKVPGGRVHLESQHKDLAALVNGTKRTVEVLFTA